MRGVAIIAAARAAAGRGTFAWNGVLLHFWARPRYVQDAIRLGHPLIGVGGGEKFLVRTRSRVDEPVVAGSVGVEGDGGIYGLAESASSKVCEVKRDAAASGDILVEFHTNR